MRFGFLVNEVLTGLRRNVTMTVAMILTTAISIGLFGGGLLVVRLADSSRAIYLDRVESQVFLTDDVSANDPNCDAEPCQALRKLIDDRDDVKSVTLPEQARTPTTTRSRRSRNSRTSQARTRSRRRSSSSSPIPSSTTTSTTRCEANRACST